MCFILFVHTVHVCADRNICLLSPRLPNAFALNSTHPMTTAGSASEDISSPVETDTLKIEEVQAPATGTRKAKVLYDYDAADSSELSLLADEVRFHHYPAVSRLNSDCWSLARNVSRSREKKHLYAGRKVLWHCAGILVHDCFRFENI